jgi:hypothetical protein
LHPQKEEKQLSGGIVSGFMEIIEAYYFDGVGDGGSFLLLRVYLPRRVVCARSKMDVHQVS